MNPYRTALSFSAILYALMLVPGCKPTPNPSTSSRIVAAGLITDYPIGSIIPAATTRGTNNPKGIAHLGLAAWWFEPDTNEWVAEWSTNGATWAPTGNQWASPHSIWHFTETGTNWTLPGGGAVNVTDLWTVRIRRIK